MAQILVPSTMRGLSYDSLRRSGHLGPAPTASVYDGHVVVLMSLPSVRELVDYTRDEVVDVFKPYDPEYAHEHIDVAEMAKVLGSWKPRFVHSPTSKDLVCNIIPEAGLSPEGTHYDVSKPRTSFPVGHLTTGIAYAYPWHRDECYGAPAQQNQLVAARVRSP
jgi:hypothetical protein